MQRVEVDRETTAEDGRPTAAVVLRLGGRGDLNTLAAELSELQGIRRASTNDEQFDE